MRECFRLLKYGVPFDVAFSIPNNLRVAWLIIGGEAEGKVFDWSNLDWKS